jgi:hypothetical protein
MANLLKETLYLIKHSGKTENDILWVGTSTEYMTWENFKKIADTDYDESWGSPKVAQDLMIVGDGWWVERGEYDGSEWWEFKQIPVKPEKLIEAKALTVNQAEKLGYEVSCGWESLARINNMEEEE